MAQSVKHLLFKLWGLRLILQDPRVNVGCGHSSVTPGLRGKSRQSHESWWPASLANLVNSRPGRESNSSNKVTMPQEWHSKLTSGLHTWTCPCTCDHTPKYTHIGKVKIKVMFAWSWACMGNCSLADLLSGPADPQSFELRPTQGKSLLTLHQEIPTWAARPPSPSDQPDFQKLAW